MKTHPIPPDRSAWDHYYQLEQQNQEIVRAILEKASQEAKTGVARKVGDYFGSCMDEAAIEKKGTEPLNPELQRIAAVKTRADFAAEIAHLHSIGVDVVFGFYANQDLRMAEQMIPELNSGGLGVGRDYYLTSDSSEIRAQYREHINKMLQLSGMTHTAAGQSATAVVKIETEMAKAIMDRVQARDIDNHYHKIDRAALAELTPAFDWSEYFKTTGAPGFHDVNVADLGFFKGLNHLLDSTSFAEWKPYLRWHLIHEMASVLPERLVNEDFHFYGFVLEGKTEHEPRWKHCEGLVNRDLGEAVGQLFVKSHFTAQEKQQVLELIQKIKKDLLATDENTYSKEAEAKRMVAVEFLTDAVAWDDNPAMGAVMGAIEEVVFAENISSATPEDLVQSLAGDKMELYTQMLHSSPDRAAIVAGHAQGKDVEALLTYSKDWYEREMRAMKADEIH